MILSLLAAAVFSLTPVDQAPDPAVYKNPYVTGVAVRIAWDTIEPADGVYDFSLLDGVIRDAGNAGKKVSLYIAISGSKQTPSKVPDWVYRAGARGINTSQGLLPVPWDKIYQAKLYQLFDTVGRHAGHKLAYVRGATEAVTNGWSMTDAIAWGAAGYSDANMALALRKASYAIMAGFPYTPIWLEVGNIDVEDAITGNAPDTVAFAYEATNPPGKYWQEALSDCTPDPPTQGFWQILWTDRPASAQMLWSVQDGGVRMDPCGKPISGKLQALENAIQVGGDYGMSYYEIYQVDVLDPSLQPALALASKQTVTLFKMGVVK